MAKIVHCLKQIVDIVWSKSQGAHCWHIYGLNLDKFNYFPSTQLVLVSYKVKLEHMNKKKKEEAENKAKRLSIS